LGLLLFIVAVLTIRHLATARRFQVSEVEVTGTRLLSPAEVRDQAALMGVNIFTVNERQVERELLRHYACLHGVQVRCRLPGACRVQVSEIADVIIWEQGDEALWVAPDGEVLGAATTITDAPTLVNSGNRLEPQAGYLVGVPWGYALEASRALGAGQKLEFVSGYGLMVRLGDRGLPVYLGDEGDVVAKLGLAADILAEATRRGLQITYIDLRSGARPVVGGL